MGWSAEAIYEWSKETQPLSPHLQDGFETDDEFNEYASEEDEYEEHDEQEFSLYSSMTKQLPPLPPLSQILPDSPPATQTHPQHESVVHRIMDAVRGRSRSNSRSTLNCTLDTSSEMVDKYRHGGVRLNPHLQAMSPIASSSPRSPTSGRRQFVAQTGIKRTKSQSLAAKLKNRHGRPRNASVSVAPPILARGTETIYPPPMQIHVSTQTTEKQSAHDALRPRVFYPRSSSLIASAELQLAALGTSPPRPGRSVLSSSANNLNRDPAPLPPAAAAPSSCPGRPGSRPLPAPPSAMIS
ncbi:hypothetical protein HMN09_01196500 [Mycena chlorophos]|uniref:Uncharacterized protein n=1 Tax=Mycena chlorophos TaxID=658473 RepID=A0A8H6S8E8_MYCCL|nr:hypothetical protein HMN09_01196500 [Mycena chlorophos]